MRKLLFKRSLSLALLFLRPVLLIIAPVFVLVCQAFREAIPAPSEILASGKFNMRLALPKLLPFESLPRPRQMLAQMGHRTNLA